MMLVQSPDILLLFALFCVVLVFGHGFYFSRNIYVFNMYKSFSFPKYLTIETHLSWALGTIFIIHIALLPRFP